MKIGIIGAGASGLVAAWLLHDHHEITLFERQSRLGGNARTVDLDICGFTSPVAVDVGFEYFGGTASYPNFHKLLDLLSVPIRHRPVDATVHSLARKPRLVMPPWRKGSIDWPALSPRSLIDLLRFARFIADVACMQQEALRTMTIHDYLETVALPAGFKSHLLRPFLHAQFGMPREMFASLSAYDALKFCELYGANGIGRERLHSVAGGSRTYVNALARRLGSTCIRLGAVIRAIERRDGSYTIDVRDQGLYRCDHLIVTTGPAAARELLPRAEGFEEIRRILATIDVYNTRITVHSDSAVMPARRTSWSTFNVHDLGREVALTIWYRERAATPFFRSWTTFDPRRLSHVYGEFDFQHTVGNRRYYEAQKQLRSIQGRDNLWFAGSWTQDNDSHESAVTSAIALAAALDPTSPNLGKFGLHGGRSGSSTPEIFRSFDRAQGS